MYKDLRVLFIGIPDMAYVCLDGMVEANVNIVGVMGAKKNHITYYTFKQHVMSLGLNYIDYDDLCEDKLIENIKSLKPDIAVVCSFNYKVPKVLLDCVKGGFINTHPALLPDYRGPNPYSSVIINDEKETGVTLHLMDEEFDTGDIVLQKAIPIMSTDTMGTLFNKLNVLGLDMLLEALELFSIGKLERRKQPKDGNFKYAKKIDDNTLDFNKSAKYLERFVRALNPFITTRTTFRNIQVTVFSAEATDEDVEGFDNGTIVKVENDRIYVKTQKGLFVPTSIQFGGFFISSVKEFVRIMNPQVGERLGI